MKRNVLISTFICLASLLGYFTLSEAQSLTDLFLNCHDAQKLVIAGCVLVKRSTVLSKEGARACDLAYQKGSFAWEDCRKRNSEDVFRELTKEEQDFCDFLRQLVAETCKVDDNGNIVGR